MQMSGHDYDQMGRLKGSQIKLLSQFPISLVIYVSLSLLSLHHEMLCGFITTGMRMKTVKISGGGKTFLMVKL